MDTLTKEELEIILKAIKLLTKAGVEERKALSTITEETKEAYIRLVMTDLK